MKKARKCARPISADAIARMADKGQDVSQFFTGQGRIVGSLKSMESADIKNRRWTETERRALRRVVQRQEQGNDSHIDFKDIPRLTEKQLASMARLRDARPRRPSIGC